MAARLLTKEAFNLFAGDGAQEEGKHLVITNVGAPTFREMTVDHKAGGSIGALSIGGLGFEALEFTFKISGYDAQTRGLIGVPGRYTGYTVMRDKQTGAEIELKVVVFGVMQEMAPSEDGRGDIGQQDHKIGEITHYEEYLGAREVYYYDWAGVEFRAQGVDKWAARRRILRV